MEKNVRPVLLRLEPELVRQIDHLTVDFDIYRTYLIELLVRKGLQEVDSGVWSLKEMIHEFLEQKEERLQPA